MTVAILLLTGAGTFFWYLGWRETRRQNELHAWCLQQVSELYQDLEEHERRN